MQKRYRRICSILIAMIMFCGNLALPLSAAGEDFSRAYAGINAMSSQTGLVGEWAFNEQSNSKSPDTLLMHDTDISNASLAQGKVGRALNLSGYLNYATIPNGDLINTAGDFTMSFLAMHEFSGTDRNPILIQQQGVEVNLLTLREDGRLQSELGGITTLGATRIEPNKWYHIALVREDDTIRVYVNGAVDVVSSGALFDYNMGDLRIGNHSTPDRAYLFQGKLDEMQIYNRALSDNELYHATGFYWPQITLNGQQDMTLDLNDTYVEDGATAEYQGASIALTTSGTVDTSKAGTYFVTYTASGGGETVSKIRVVKVITPKTLSRGSSLMIEKGFQFQTWMKQSDAGGKQPTADEWNGSNFTTATYYMGNNYNKALHDDTGAQWGLVVGTGFDAGGILSTGLENKWADLNSNPSKDYLQSFLTNQADYEAATSDPDMLTTVCFGDEENYSPAVVQAFKKWFEKSKEQHPEAMVHSNQQARQWSLSQYTDYMKTAEPDLLTFDDYLFSTTGNDINKFTEMVNYISAVRIPALAGYDGTGQSPIPFGQYLLGFRTGGTQGASGSYLITESQIYAVPFTTATMGGKWLSLFRWWYNTENDNTFILFDYDGGSHTPTDQYRQYAEVAKQLQNLGDHLVRLNSTDVYFNPGQAKVAGNTVTNNMPKFMTQYNEYAALAHPYLLSVETQNIGTANGGLRGDVLLGFFEPLPDQESFFGGNMEDIEYFMVTNGLTQGNGITNTSQQNGSGVETAQEIELTFDMGKYDPDALQKVDKQTGTIESVSLSPAGGDLYTLTLNLNGGSGELFKLDKTKLKAGYNAVTGISLDPASITMDPGQTQTITANVQPVNATKQDVVWSSSDPDVASVSQSGVVTAESGGKAFITAKTIDGNLRATCKVIVRDVYIPVESIELNPSAKTLYEGETVQLTAIAKPLKATNRVIVWKSSDVSVAEVDSRGLVTAKSTGTAVITGNASNETQISGSCSITVIDINSDANLTDLTVNDGTNNVDIGFDPLVTSYSVNIDPSVEYLYVQPFLPSAEGTVTAAGGNMASGQIAKLRIPEGLSSFHIDTCSADQSQNAQYTINVRRSRNIARDAVDVYATSSEHGEQYYISDYEPNDLNGPNAMVDGDYNTPFISNYSTKTASEQFNDVGDGATHKIVMRWNDPQTFNKVVFVTDNGVNQGITVFDFLISENGSDWEEVWCPEITWSGDQPNVFERIEMDPSLSGGPESIDDVVAIFFNIWNANLLNGRYKVAELELYNDFEATEPISFVSAETVDITAVALNQSQISVRIGEAFQLRALIAPENATNRSIIWSTSDSTIATVNSKGEVLGKNTGGAVITATSVSSDLKAYCDVTVISNDNNADLTSLSVNDVPLEDFSEDKDSYFISVEDEDDVIVITPRTESPGAVMMVDGTSFVNGQSIEAAVPMGKSEIQIICTAADGITEKTYALTIRRSSNIAMKADSILFIDDDSNFNDAYASAFSMASGASLSISPYMGSAAPEMIDGDKDTAFISNQYREDLGNLRADNGEFDPCHGIILKWSNEYSFNEIYISSERAQSHGLLTFCIQEKNNGTALAEINPGGESDFFPNWQTDEPGLVETWPITLRGHQFTNVDGLAFEIWKSNLDEDGRYSISEIEIYNNIDSGESPAILIIGEPDPEPVPVEEVNIIPDRRNLIVGSTYQLTAEVLPENADDASLTWASSNESVAVVDQDGSVEALNPGDAVISATAVNGIKGECSVHVLPREEETIPVSAVVLSPALSEMHPGEELHLTAAFLPENASNKALAWASSNPDIASVDQNGIVRAIAEGNAEISAIASNNVNGTAIIQVVRGSENNVPEENNNGSSSPRKSSGGTSYESDKTTEKKPSSMEINVNGEKRNASGIDTSKDKYVLNVTFENNTATVTIPSDVLSYLMEQTENHKTDFVIEINSDIGVYYLPVDLAAHAAGLKDMLQKNGLSDGDFSLNVVMTNQSDDKDIQEAFGKQFEAGRMLDTVSFQIFIIDNKTDKSIGEINVFEKPVERMVKVSGANKLPQYYGAFVFNDRTRKFAFVPHKGKRDGDSQYVLISSYTNSVYMVAENHITFTDVTEGFWGKPFVEQAAAKYLVTGSGNDLYEPNRSITRAELVQMICNALHLQNAPAQARGYSDVSKDNWYYTSIMKAKEAGLLVGLVNTTDAGMLKPNQPITREEMASVLANTARYLNVSSSKNGDLTRFIDFDKMDNALLEDINLVTQLRIMNGMSERSFDPKGETTRAQAATVLINMLRAFKMID